MRWSEFFIPTTKETPSEATVPSHVLMIRAGLVRQLVAGAYVYLPLGLRVLQKVTDIIRQEMNKAGGIELHMPAMHPIELWRETGRADIMGDTLIHLPDQPWRSGTVLGPTHEEVITDIVRAFISSYKQLPINLYQIQTKFRDEKRPKSGILRTREFLMKDAYSFDRDLDGLNRSYQQMYDAYCQIFGRCGLPYVAVEADSGAIGGDASHEFMVRTDAGEDILARTADGSYAANVERAAIAPLPDSAAPGSDSISEVETPKLGSVEQVSKFLGCDAADMIKTIIFVGDGEPLAALVRGDHEVNEAKLRKLAGVSTLAAADAKTIQSATGADVGFAGPVGLSIRIIADPAVMAMRDAISGANKADTHIRGVNPGRDFSATTVGDIRYAAEGDRAPNGEAFVFEKCIEVGHVFKLGTKYSGAMKANFLDENGSSHPCVMGCYGIGANRIVAAAVETYHDDSGILWPMTIAPFHVVICCLDPKDEIVGGAAEQIHDALSAAGVEVLLDDRDIRPGPKFKDADLIGVPLRITVGRKHLANGQVELKNRDSDEVMLASIEETVAETQRRVSTGLASES
jgi:prolyl-tRNA synthetase